MSSTKFIDTWEGRHNSIIVFAGVFDPVHSGHISAAKKALHYGSKVVFMPERVPQHKHSATGYQHRLNMLRIATQQESDIEVVDYPEDHHWIIESFQWIKKENPNKDIVWLVGNDVSPKIESWKGVDRLRDLGVKLILVVMREGNETERQEVIAGVPVINLVRPMGLDMKTNSSFIRQNISLSKDNLLPEVYEYIRQNNLYE